MGASTAPLPDDIEGLRAQNRAYRSLCASLEAAQAIQTEHGRKSHEAVTTLDSEREANARLTDEVERMRAALVKIAKVEDGYRSQMKFCDIDPLPYFREFTDRLHQTGYRAALSHPHSGTPTPKEGE